MLDKEAQADFRANTLRANYELAGPLANGWESDSREALVEYSMASVHSDYGPVVYTGLNRALADDATIQCSGIENFNSALRVGTPRDWLWVPEGSIHEMEILPVRTLGAIYLQGAKGVGFDRPFVTRLTLLESEGDYVRISTRATLAAEELKVWGRLPSPESYYWTLYIRVAQPDGLPYNQAALSSAPGEYHIGDPDGTDEVVLITQEENLETSHRLKDLTGVTPIAIRLKGLAPPQGSRLIEPTIGAGAA